ncbi:molybdopterin-binding protein [soil metagenome]
MAFGLIIIGDEILSGRRTDQHFPKVLEILSARGLQLAWAEYLGDDPTRITATLKRTLACGDIVFSCGGIGATPDDHTRQCAAAALGVPIVPHPEGVAKIKERIADMAREHPEQPAPTEAEALHRLKMADFPQGAEIIPNPFNKIPGFSIVGSNGNRHYFVPGFPVMAWPMIEWVLDTHYAHLFHQVPHIEKSLLVFEAMESTLTPLMEELEAEFSKVKVFSLPSVGDANTRRHIELGVKGDPEQTSIAFDKMQAALTLLRFEFQIPATQTSKS